MGIRVNKGQPRKSGKTVSGTDVKKIRAIKKRRLFELSTQESKRLRQLAAEFKKTDAGKSVFELVEGYAAHTKRRHDLETIPYVELSVLESMQHYLRLFEAFAKEKSVNPRLLEKIRKANLSVNARAYMIESIIKPGSGR